MVDAGLIVMVALISPFRTERQMARELFNNGEFFQLYLDTPFDICEARDSSKGTGRVAQELYWMNTPPYEPPKPARAAIPRWNFAS